MQPKPPPPDSLLLHNQHWTIVPAVHWVLGTTRNSCYYAIERGHRCGKLAAIQEIPASQSIYSREGLCVEHLGTHMWIGDDGVLYQWRADPPYINKTKPKYERWTKRAANRNSASKDGRDPGEGS